jgi:hypothetical protein
MRKRQARFPLRPQRKQEIASFSQDPLPRFSQLRAFSVTQTHTSHFTPHSRPSYHGSAVQNCRDVRRTTRLPPLGSQLTLADGQLTLRSPRRQAASPFALTLVLSFIPRPHKPTRLTPREVVNTLIAPLTSILLCRLFPCTRNNTATCYATNISQRTALTSESRRTARRGRPAWDAALTQSTERNSQNDTATQATANVGYIRRTRSMTCVPQNSTDWRK